MASISNKFDVDAALSSILHPNHPPIDLPDNATEISKLLGKGNRLYTNLYVVANRLEKGRALNTGTIELVAAWLQALHTLELLHPRYRDISQIDEALKRVIDPQYHFPAPYPEIATVVLAELEEANWGEEVVEGDKDGGLNDEAPDTNFRAVVQATPATSSTPTCIHAANNDPIFGAGGIMHDIEIWRGERTSYRLAEGYRKPIAQVFGDNGIAVGTVWARQVAALRDGAHGHIVAGISGGINGCYSIIVSGLYDGIDQDKGGVIYYSDSNAKGNRAPLPVPSPGTDALRRSITTGNPVRVLRSSSGSWAGRPSAGLRYDGLYRVVEMNSNKKNKWGGGFVQFRLVRISPQTPIVRDAPDPALATMINRVAAGVTRPR